jgi:hypothetical protein
MIRPLIHLAIAVAAAFLTIPLHAATITVDSITFQSQDKAAVKSYLRAREQFQASDKHYASIREGYTKKTATIQDYTKAKEDFVAARTKMLELECSLEIVPTISDGEPESWSRDELRQQHIEARKVRDRITLIKETLEDSKAYRQELKNILARFRNHAAESTILLHLGDAHRTTPDMAIKFYAQAANCPVASDPWSFSQQAAWQRLATLYEDNEAYAKGIQALENWNISEPCGTGVKASRERKEAKLQELREKLERRKASNK